MQIANFRYVVTKFSVSEIVYSNAFMGMLGIHNMCHGNFKSYGGESALLLSRQEISVNTRRLMLLVVANGFCRQQQQNEPHFYDSFGLLENR